MTSKLLYKPLIHSYGRFKYFFSIRMNSAVWERFFSLRGPVLTLPQRGRQPELEDIVIRINVQSVSVLNSLSGQVLNCS